MARFDGKVVLLTGAASGIGRATTVRLVSEGAQVFAVDVNGPGLDETAALATASGGPAVTTKIVDVSQRAECQAAVADCVAAFGRLDVLGNIAGIARADNVVDVTQEHWDRMIGVNVSGCFWMAQAAIPHLLETTGNIVNIASNAGINGQAYTVSYCMTKGAVIQLTKALAMEFMKKPIRINAIAPGGVATTLSNTYQMPADIDMSLLGRYMGFRGMAEPEELASMFSLVACEESVNIHGAVLSSDRGMTAG